MTAALTDTEFIGKACFLLHGAHKTGLIYPHILVCPSSSLEKVDIAVHPSLGEGDFTSCQLIKPNRAKTIFVFKSILLFSLNLLRLCDYNKLPFKQKPHHQIRYVLRAENGQNYVNNLLLAAAAAAAAAAAG